MRPALPLRPLLARLAAAAVAFAPPVHAAPGCAADAMLVFDGSGSMSEIGFDSAEATRIEDARRAVARAMPGIAPLRRVGLVIYGPGGADACGGIDLRFAPLPDAAGPVIAAVDALQPGGLTPLTSSVLAATGALEGQEGVVVLVTDGNETCGGRPCALGAELAARAPGLVVHVIGFRVRVDFWTWDNPEQKSYSARDSVAKCLADRTGGMFVTTETVDELVEALRETLGCPLIGRAQPGGHAVALPGAARG